MTTVQKIDRDNAICRDYRDGATLDQVAERVGLTRERVRQILRTRGVLREDRANRRGARSEHLGVLVTEDDKALVRAEAKRRGVSISALTSDIIQEVLAKKETA